MLSRALRVLCFCFLFWHDKKDCVFELQGVVFFCGGGTQSESACLSSRLAALWFSPPSCSSFPSPVSSLRVSPPSLSARRCSTAAASRSGRGRPRAAQAMAPKGGREPPAWQRAAGERLDWYQRRLEEQQAAAAAASSGQSSGAASSGAGGVQAAGKGGQAEPPAAWPAPYRPPEQRGAAAAEPPPSWGLPPPRPVEDAEGERQAMRLSRTSPANFSPTRRAVMVCGRPVVVPSACRANMEWRAGRGGRAAGSIRLCLSFVVLGCICFAVGESHVRRPGPGVDA